MIIGVLFGFESCNDQDVRFFDLAKLPPDCMHLARFREAMEDESKVVGVYEAEDYDHYDCERDMLEKAEVKLPANVEDFITIYFP